MPKTKLKPLEPVVGAVTEKGLKMSVMAVELAQKFHTLISMATDVGLDSEQIKTAFVMSCQYDTMEELNKAMESL